MPKKVLRIHVHYLMSSKDVLVRIKREGEKVPRRYMRKVSDSCLKNLSWAVEGLVNRNRGKVSAYHDGWSYTSLGGE